MKVDAAGYPVLTGRYVTCGGMDAFRVGDVIRADGKFFEICDMRALDSGVRRVLVFTNGTTLTVGHFKKFRIYRLGKGRHGE